ncbi:MAG: tetratricopeptide repeat protein [Planctomycetes bacterium]|nr:tetratricopeptide repeat protein [Planctomycetota bacterium]
MPQLLIHMRSINYFSSMLQLAGTLWLSIRIVALTSLCALLSCSSKTDTYRDRALGIKVDQQLTDAQNLERFANAEENSTKLKPLLVPPPPGVDPHILAIKSPIDPKAMLSLDQALKEISSHNTDESIALFDIPEIDSQAQENALRHYLKGRDAALSSRHSLARTEFENSLRLDPYNPAVLRASAKSLLALRMRRQATVRYQRLLEIEPNDSEAIFEVGLSATMKLQHIQAVLKLGRPHLTGEKFDHDPGAEYIANYTLQVSLKELGYDSASIQIARMVVDKPFRITRQTVHLKRIENIHIRKPEIWRQIGDTHCRLGEYAKALKAYKVSASLPISDPTPLSYRIIYANLKLGRIYSAQLKLLEGMQSQQVAISESVVLLCRYLAKHVTETKLLANSVANLYKESPDDPLIARAAASLMPPQDAVLLLRQFLERRPEDLYVLSQLLEWLLIDDPCIAVELVAKMCADRPHYARNYCKRLAVASPRISDLFNTIKQLPLSASVSLVNAQLLFYVDGIGEAWGVSVNALADWPNDLGLRLLQLDIAAYIKDTQLFDKVSKSLDQFNDVPTWIARARANRAIGDTEAALSASEKALLLDNQSIEALTERARCFTLHALVQASTLQQSDVAHQAITAADRAIKRNAKYEDAYAALFEIYGQAGPFPSADLYEETAIRLRSSLPDSALLKRIKAQQQGRQGRFEQAVEQFLSIYENDPNDTISMELAVTSWLRQGNTLAAQQWIDQRLAQKPDDPNLLEQWARLRLNHRRTDEVIQKMKGVIAKQSINYVAKDILALTYRIIGQTEKYVDIALERLLTRPKGFSREIELAVLQIQAKRFDDAKKRLQWVYDSRDNATHGQLLSAVTIAGELPDANKLVLDYSDYIFDRFSSTPMIVYGLALRALARSGQIEERFDVWADRAASNARSFEYNSAIYIRRWQQLLQLLIDAKQPQAASRAIRAPFRLEKPLTPLETERLLTLAVVADAAANQSAATIEIIRDLAIDGILPLDPRNPAASDLDLLTVTFFDAAQRYSVLGKEEGAVQILQQAVIVNPQYALAHNNLGYARLELGATDRQMIDSIEKAYELQPDDPNIIDTIGWLRYKQGRFEDVGEEFGAVTLLELAMSLDTVNSEVVLEHVGDARWRAGDTPGALQVWQNALRLLNNPAHRRHWTGVYTQLQTDPEIGWGLLVTDPKKLYHNNFGIVLERISAKLEAVKQGKQPKTAAIFAEYISDTDSGDTQDGRP